jgi:hypothetical protein
MKIIFVLFLPINYIFGIFMLPRCAMPLDFSTVERPSAQERKTYRDKMTRDNPERFSRKLPHTGEKGSKND